MSAPRRLNLFGMTSSIVSGSWWTVPLACVATAAPCSEAPLVFAFLEQALRRFSKEIVYRGSGLAPLGTPDPKRLYTLTLVCLLPAQRSDGAYICLRFSFFGYSPGSSHVSKICLSIPAAGVAQRNRCGQNLLTACVFVAGRHQFCNDVILGTSDFPSI